MYVLPTSLRNESRIIELIQKTVIQPLDFVNVVYFAVNNIDHLEVFMPEIQIISHKHRDLAVRSEHNPILGKHMLQSILDALSAAYTFIVGILIDTEKKL